MKLKRFSKQFIAVVIAIALVLVGNYFVPKTIDASTVVPESTWVPDGTSSWHVRLTAGGTVDGGATLSDTITTTVAAYKDRDYDVRIESPKVNVEAGETYVITATLNTSVEYKNMHLQAFDGKTCYDSTSNPATTIIAKGDISHTPNQDIVWSTTFTPTKSYITIMFASGWSKAGSITISDISITKQSETTTGAPEPTTAIPETTTVDPDAWQDVTTYSSFNYVYGNNDGFQYRFGSSHTGSQYKGGRSLDESLHLMNGKYVDSDDSGVQAITPAIPVVSGKTYKMIYNVACSRYQSKNIQIKIKNSANEQTIATSEKYSIGTKEGDVGGDVDIVLTYEAPSSGSVYFQFYCSYAAHAEFTLTPYNEDESNYIDVTDYKAQGTYPTRYGKVFAGWFTDDTCTTAYTETTGVAYAKFIDEDVLGPVKFQQATDGTAIRFLSSVDCTDYQSAGFIISGSYDGHSITNKTRAAKKLYEGVKAGGIIVYPTIFSPESNYFFTYTVDGLESGKDMTWNVTPYFVTADGTTVTGIAGEWPEA